MEAATHLRPVKDSDLLVDPSTGQAVDAAYKIRDLEDERVGLISTIEKQARTIGQLERRVTEEEDPNSHPKGKEIVGVIERWMRGSGHTKAKVSADRIKLVKSRLRDSYELSTDEWLPEGPTIELAVDGICAFPYVVNGQRKREGQSSQRHDRLGIALAGGEKVEEFSRLGYLARKNGWVTWN